MVAKIIRGIAAAVLFFFLCLGVHYLERTETDPWIPIGGAVAIAFASLLLPMRMRCRITGLRNDILINIITFTAVGIIAFSGTLMLNYEIPSGRPTEVRAEIVGKNVRTEYGTRRVGRGRYIRDTSRKVYHYEYTLRIPGGKTIKRHTDAQGYIRLRCGHHETVTLRQGCLGWTVVY